VSGAAPERDLLLACAAWDPGVAGRDRAHDCARRVNEWDAWLRLVRLHRLVPHAQRVLDDDDATTPGLVLDELRSETRAIAARALARAGQLAELVRTLEAAEVRALAFKGPALSLAAYGEIGVRDSVDLDLVVRRGELERASAAIRAAGYASRHGMSAVQERTLQRAFGHFSYTRAGAPAMVELHWRFAARRYPWSLPPDDVLGRARAIEIGGERVTVPDPTDDVLLQAMHGARHQWERLEWLVAFTRLLHRGGVDPPLLIERARAYGSDRALRTALRLARDLTATTLPPALEAIASDAATASRSDEVRRGIDRAIVAGAMPVTQPYAQNLRMMDGAGDRARYLALSVFAPTVREWEVARLPDFLMALYYPFRLVRVLARRVRAVFATR
jgi:hypothetical protein